MQQNNSSRFVSGGSGGSLASRSDCCFKEDQKVRVFFFLSVSLLSAVFAFPPAKESSPAAAPVVPCLDSISECLLLATAVPNLENKQCHCAAGTKRRRESQSPKHQQNRKIFGIPSLSLSLQWVDLPFSIAFNGVSSFIGVLTVRNIPCFGHGLILGVSKTKSK